jgi:YebC/PmpR family DNA-binding regulatory protein
VGRGPSIENRKNAEDARRGKLFTKLIREITVAARKGADAAGNPRLRMAMDKALHANMSKDTIERAVKRGSGGADGAQLEEVRYEGYAPGGVAVMVDCMTDNRVRTVGEVRHAFTKEGGNLGADGSVAYLFKHLGVVGFETGSDDALAEKILEVALEASADDVVTADGWTEVLTSPETFEAVKQALLAAGLKPAQADVTWHAGTTVRLEGAQAETVAKLIERLEELDDVQNVHTNAAFPRSVRAAA